MTKNEKKYVVGFLIIISIIYASVLWLPKVMEGHDTTFHVQRLINITEGLKNGYFPVRIAPDMYNGFGYSTQLFYCDILFYIPAFLALLGLPMLSAYKVLLISICVMTTVSTFYCSYKIIKDINGATICTVAACLSNYFAADIFTRGAVGETSALIFIPWALLGIYNVVMGDDDEWWPLLVGFGGLLMCHILSFSLMSIFFAVFLILNLPSIMKEKNRIWKIALGVISTIGVSAWFLFPFAEQMLTTKYLSSYHIKIYNPAQSALRTRNLFFDVTPSGLYAPNLGVMMILFFVVSVAFLFVKAKNPKEKFLKLCTLGGIFCMFASTVNFPWLKLDPYLNSIQFPWRLHAFTTFFLAFSGGYGISVLCKKVELKHFAAIVTCVIFLLSSGIYTSTAVKEYKKAETEGRFVDLSQELIFVDEFYLHANTNRKLFATRDKFEGKIRGVNYTITGKCERLDYNLKRVTFSDNEGKDNLLEAPIHYYYGYEALDVESNKVLQTSPSEYRGWLQMDISGMDSGVIEIRYVGTFIQKISPWISIFSVLCLIILKKKKDKMRK